MIVLVLPDREFKSTRRVCGLFSSFEALFENSVPEKDQRSSNRKNQDEPRRTPEKIQNKRFKYPKPE